MDMDGKGTKMIIGEGNEETNEEWMRRGGGRCE
jgi:hypothetical protein